MDPAPRTLPCPSLDLEPIYFFAPHILQPTTNPVQALPIPSLDLEPPPVVAPTVLPTITKGVQGQKLTRKRKKRRPHTQVATTPKHRPTNADSNPN